MNPNRNFHPRSRRTRAFTLVELLVVIAIISILMTVGAIGLSGMGGKNVTAGVATVESLFDEARTTAVGRNLRSAVLVSQTLTNNPGDDLRRVLVAYEQTDPATGQASNPDSSTPNWMVTSRGTLLPEQTFFSQEFSRQNHKTGAGQIETISHTRLRRESGGTISSAFQGNWFIYEFNSQGIMKTPGASFIIGTGSRNSAQPATGNNRPRVTSSARRDFGGFVIWRNGRTSVFRSPDQMGSGIRNITSGSHF